MARLCCVKSCLVFHQPHISSFNPSPPAHSVPSNATGYELCTRFTSVVSSFILSPLPQRKRRLISSLISTTPCLHPHTIASHCRALIGAPHPFWLPAEKGGDGHYALLQKLELLMSGLACLAKTHFNAPARMKRDDEISWISEQEWATSISFSPCLYVLNSFQGDFSNCTEILHG